jgi:hypothetical protein
MLSWNGSSAPAAANQTRINAIFAVVHDGRGGVGELDRWRFVVSARETGMYVNAGSLFKNAVEVCDGLTASAAIQARRDALVSIVLATISTEAFINELHNGAEAQSGAAAPGWINALGYMLGEAEKSRASIESKYQLARFILTGQPFDRGVSPSQDFALLISVRNLIVHAKPQDAKVRRDADGKLVWVEPNIMCRLQGSRVLGVSESLRNAASTLGADTIVSDMLAEISTHSVAQWACKAAAGL